MDASAEVRQRDAELRAARAGALAAGLALAPELTASGGYTRNQYEIVVEIPRGPTEDPIEAVITPQDQLDVTAKASLPLVDVAAWMRTGAARARVGAADATREETAIQVRRDVTAAWFQLSAAGAVRGAALAARDAASADLSAAEAGAAAGTALTLDVARARAAVAAADRLVAEADVSIAAARRALRERTGVDVTQASAPPADLSGPAPVEAWLNDVDQVASVDAAEARWVAARQDAAAAWSSLAPSIEASFAERITNGAGFGEPAAWSAGVQAQWTLGAGAGASAAERSATAVAQRAALDVARRDAEETVRAAWERVVTLRAAAVAAVAEADAEVLAVADWRARLAAGSATLADVLGAERDHLDAEATRLRALADLEAARVDLALLSGRPVESR